MVEIHYPWDLYWAVAKNIEYLLYEFMFSTNQSFNLNTYIESSKIRNKADPKKGHKWWQTENRKFLSQWPKATQFHEIVFIPNPD